MKNLFITTLVLLGLISTTSFSLPNFWYSATAYNNLGQIIVSPTMVETYITVSDGTNTYIEQFLSGGVGALAVNDFGVFSVQIGTGGVVSGTLSSVQMKSSTTTNVKVRPVGSSTWVTVAGSALSTVYLNNYTAPSSLSLPNGQIYIGNSSGNAQAQTMSGDATLNNTGVLTISTDAVNSSKIADGSIMNSDINSAAGINVSKLAAGSNGQVLTTVGGIPTWSVSGSGIPAPAGAVTDDLLYYDGSNWIAKKLVLANTGSNVPINNMQPYLVINFCIALQGIFPSRNGIEPYIGEIEMFGFNFNPVGWATCDGQLLAISQNTALFSLLGTQYGGNGISTFALPDLRGRVPIHQGQGSGLSPRTIGEMSGTETTTLIQNNLPAHTHAISYQ